MMLSSQKLGCSKVAPFGRRPARRALCVAAKSQGSQQDASLGRRNFLTALGFLSTLSAAQAAQAAADPYEELKKISAARGGEGSLLERFESTRTAVATTKADRGIRAKLASEASNALKPKPAPTSGSSSSSFNLFGGSSSGGPKPAAPKPLAPRPAVALAPKAAAAPAAFRPAAVAPKAAAAAPKAAAPAAAAAGAGAGGAALGPIAQAVGVLGAVAVGANAVTSFATSNKKGKARPASPAAAAAPAAASAAAPSSTKKVSSGTAKKVSSSTAKVAVSAPAAAAVSSTRKVASSTKKVAKRAPVAAAAATGTVRATIKKALVNEEQPDEPTDFAVAGILGAAALLAAFFLFGLPEPIPSGPSSSSSTSDPLVQAAKEAAARAGTPAYTTPLYKAQSNAAMQTARKEIAAAAKPAPAVVVPAPVPVPVPVPVPAPAAPKPAAVVEAPAPKPAPAAPKPAAVVETPAAKPAPAAPKPAAVVEAPAPAPAAKPAAPAVVQKSVEPKKDTPAAAASATEAAAASGPNNLVVIGGSLALIVAAFAAVGGDSSEQSASGTTPAEGSSSNGNGAAPAAGDAAAAEPVSASVSSSAPAGVAAPSDNAAYEQAVNALFADPDTADELYGIIAPALRNGPALAWALVSNQTNAETLDGWAFQKLPTSKYQRVRQLLSDMGLALPETPKPQPTLTAPFGADAAAAATAGTAAAAAAAAGSAELDPEKLRGVFEALLGNPASRTLMRKLLAGAGMPFDEVAFEEQIKDATYFNLAIAPILRKMPPQKLAVLADLQDPAKLRELVSTVSSLASDTTQLDAVTAELSGDVRNTVQKIREDSQAGTASSGR